MCTGRTRPNIAASFNIMRSLKTPFSFDLTDNDVYGEAVGENHNNNNFRNDVTRLSLTPPEQPGGDVSPLA